MPLVILRLLCAVLGRTVSLLPDFCLPRRQYGTATLAQVATTVVVRREGLRRAAVHLNVSCPPGPSSVRSLVRGMLRRLIALSAYVSALLPRMPVPSVKSRGWRRELEPVVTGLLRGFVEPESAFTHHGRRFHDRFRLGLA